MSKPSHIVGIIEDDPRTICATANVLSALGLRRQLFNSVEAFFADPRASRIGCLIVDLELADDGNADLARRLAESGRSSRIIFTLGEPGQLDFRQLMQARCLALLRKPFASGKLVDALTRWLQLDGRPPLARRH